MLHRQEDTAKKHHPRRANLSEPPFFRPHCGGTTMNVDELKQRMRMRELAGLPPIVEQSAVDVDELSPEMRRCRELSGLSYFTSPLSVFNEDQQYLRRLAGISE